VGQPQGASTRGNHKGLPLHIIGHGRGNPLWLPFAVKYLFICASVLINIASANAPGYRPWLTPLAIALGT